LATSSAACWLERGQSTYVRCDSKVQLPDPPTDYLTAVANQAASKYLSLELLSADDDDEEFVPEGDGPT